MTLLKEKKMVEAKIQGGWPALLKRAGENTDIYIYIYIYIIRTVVL